MTNIAIIPARLGSKRIKQKNIKKFYSKPMIAWTVEILKKSKIFSHIIVSTESEKIINISKKFGIKLFVERPKVLAGDNIGIKEVIIHAIKDLEKKIKFTNVCCVFPCSPFLKIENLKKSLKILKSKKNYLVHPVSEYRHPIERSLIMKKNNILTPVNPANMTKMTQDFETKYFDQGQFYFFHKKFFKKKNNKKSTIGIKIPAWDTVDFDNPEDWIFAEKLFKFKKNLT